MQHRLYRRPGEQRGFVLLWLLFCVAALGVGMAGLGTVWHTVVQREKEKDLLFAGGQYRMAIASFWHAVPQSQRRLPKDLDELLLDPRFPNTVRHLRRLFPDPMTGKLDWVLVRDASGGITGLYSRSTAPSLKKANFPAAYEKFEGSQTYSDWLFVFEGTNGLVAAGATGETAGESTLQPGGSEAAVASGSGGDVPGGVGSGTGNTVGQNNANLTACLNAMTQGFAACRPQFQNQDMAGWNACRDAVTEQFRRCRGDS